MGEEGCATSSEEKRGQKEQKTMVFQMMGQREQWEVLQSSF
jgi:hypothetical protein